MTDTAKMVEWLEKAKSLSMPDSYNAMLDSIIAALASPAGEPVAWGLVNNQGAFIWMHVCPKQWEAQRYADAHKDSEYAPFTVIPLYASPPPAGTCSVCGPLTGLHTSPLCSASPHDSHLCLRDGTVACQHPPAGTVTEAMVERGVLAVEECEEDLELDERVIVRAVLSAALTPPGGSEG